jgi:hypothetical protein
MGERRRASAAVIVARVVWQSTRELNAQLERSPSGLYNEGVAAIRSSR